MPVHSEGEDQAATDHSEVILLSLGNLPAEIVIRPMRWVIRTSCFIIFRALNLLEAVRGSATLVYVILAITG
ncbi:MAG: hypothetical protein DMF04_06430 [Verrucomicrobia bacterium]|nr:MAG: hypothetical protein DMF04_06430 [Verrucomicrobiota bacterium]